MHTPQHRKRVENKQKLLKRKFFFRCFHDLKNFLETALTLNFEVFPLYLDRFTRIVYLFPLYFILIFLRNFPILFRGFSTFLVRFLIFLYFLFFQKHLNWCFLIFLICFSFLKNFKFSFWWSVSLSVKSVSSYY